MKFTAAIIVLCFLWTGTPSAAAQQNDAVCDVELKGTDYALHLVELGDNLFRIAQKYNSTVEDIWKVNPSIVDNSIIPGQVVKVPRNSKNLQRTAPPGEMTPPEDGRSAALLTPELDPENFVYHEVGPGQTLFSISRQYSVSVEELQHWNYLNDYSIEIGQNLIVSAHGELKVYDDATAAVTSYKPSREPIRRTVNVNKHQDLLYEKFLEESRTSARLKMERGAAERLVTNNPRMQDVYYALHKDAPVGSVMKVMNLVNRKYVFVTVLAPLPDITENANVQIKLSPAATKELVILDGKSLVELSYHY